MSVPGLVGILHFSLIAENYESSIKVVSEILGDLEDDVSSATDTDKLNPTTSKSGARTSVPEVCSDVITAAARIDFDIIDIVRRQFR